MLFYQFILPDLSAPSYSVQLAGSSPNMGLVLFQFNGTWGEVCGSTWDIHGANVSCFILPYYYTGMNLPSFHRLCVASWDMRMLLQQ